MGLPRELALRLLHKCSRRTELFVVSYSLLALDGDPLAAEKKKLNELVLRRAEKLAPALERALDTETPLGVLAEANAVDVRMPWYEFSTASLEELGGRAEFTPSPEEVLEVFKRARRIAILLDNAGEAVIDTLFALLYSELSGVRVDLVARSLPYEVDVTAREAEALVEALERDLGIKGANLEVVGTESRYHAPHPLVSSEARRSLEKADLVMSKGVANLEALIEYKTTPSSKVVCIFRAKCPVLSRLFKVPLGASVVTLGYTPPGG